ncbi:hypothetical protein GY21_12255 [Cryobacterium roopkundense]|nr:hypothetical protein GY21_12255 [Cryobacterium roopkundense]
MVSIAGVLGIATAAMVVNADTFSAVHSSSLGRAADVVVQAVTADPLPASAEPAVDAPAPALTVPEGPLAPVPPPAAAPAPAVSVAVPVRALAPAGPAAAGTASAAAVPRAAPVPVAPVPAPIVAAPAQPIDEASDDDAAEFEQPEQPDHSEDPEHDD